MQVKIQLTGLISDVLLEIVDSVSIRQDLVLMRILEIFSLNKQAHL